MVFLYPHFYTFISFHSRKTKDNIIIFYFRNLKELFPNRISESLKCSVLNSCIIVSTEATSLGSPKILKRGTLFENLIMNIVRKVARYH